MVSKDEYIITKLKWMTVLLRNLAAAFGEYRGLRGDLRESQEFFKIHKQC